MIGQKLHTLTTSATQRKIPQHALNKASRRKYGPAQRENTSDGMQVVCDDKVWELAGHQRPTESGQLVAQQTHFNGWSHFFMQDAKHSIGNGDVYLELAIQRVDAL